MLLDISVLDITLDALRRPDMDRNYQEMFAAIDACYSKALQLPCVVLIYTTIDSLGWVAYGHEEQSTRIRFVRWVERYLLARLDQNCSAIDLYAARCSILHGLAWESDLSKSGKAKSLMYAMGKNTGAVPELSTKVFSDEHLVCIHVDKLIADLKAGVQEFFEEVSKDPNLSAQVKAASGKTYAAVPVAMYEKFVDAIEKLQASNNSLQARRP